MADITPNLDDGELWLPSDILPDEVVSTKKTHPEFPSELTYMEELAQQLSAYALLERSQQVNNAKPAMNFAPNFEVRHPSRFYSSVAPSRADLGFGFGVSGGGNGGRGGAHNLYASGYGGFRVGLRPVYQYCPIKPARVQVERIAHARAIRGAVQRQQQQCQSQQNRFLPFRGNGGFVRESGGTGVFFPRVALATLPTDEPKKLSVRNGEEQRQRQVVKRIGVGKEEVVGLHNSPEMALPKDWTY